MTRQYTKKTRRKTRLPKLSTTGAVTVTSDPLKDVKLDWGPIERAYVPLQPEVRYRIAEIVREYRWLDKSEHDAPYLKDALDEIDRLAKGSTKLLTALDSNTHREPDSRTSRIRLSDKTSRGRQLARRTINQFFDRSLDTPFAAVISKYLQACAAARNELICKSRDSGFQEGHAWRLMVWRLFELAKKYRLRTQVSKPNARLVRPSPFVRFVMAIQKQLADVKWRPPSTPAGVATAVYRVRSDRKNQLPKIAIETLGRNYPHRMERQ
jgi:hypothetical protein